MPLPKCFDLNGPIVVEAFASFWPLEGKLDKKIDMEKAVIAFGLVRTPSKREGKDALKSKKIQSKTE